MNNEQLILAFKQCRKALTALTVMAEKPMDNDRANLDATIKRFEFTIELFWKLLKRILSSKGIELTYPKDVIKAAYVGQLIDNEQLWLSMVYDRNMTCHTYNEELADQLYAHIKTYVPQLTEQLSALEKKLL